MKQNHENVISLLNFQLAEKASKQILLNEKMNEIEDVKAKIACVEIIRADLLNELTQERNMFNEAKNILEAQVCSVFLFYFFVIVFHFCFVKRLVFS